MNLFEAVKSRNIEEVKQALKTEGAVERCREDNLLHYAVQENQLAIVMILLNYIPINSTDFHGRTALSIVAESGNIEILKYLLSHDASPNLPDHNGNTAVFYAKNSDVIDLLVQHGADLHVLNLAQQNCMKFQSLNGNVELVKYLEIAKNFSRQNEIVLQDKDTITDDRFITINMNLKSLLNQLDISDNLAIRGLIVDGKRYKINQRFYKSLALLFKVRLETFSLFSPFEVVRRLAELNSDASFNLTLDIYKSEALSIVDENKKFLSAGQINDVLINDPRVAKIEYNSGMISAVLDLPEKWEIAGDSEYNSQINCNISVDGVGTPELTLGYLRQICSNGATVNHVTFRTKMQIEDGSGLHFSKLLKSFSNRTGFGIIQERMSIANITSASVQELINFENILLKNINGVANQILLRERLHEIAGEPCMNYGVSTLANIKDKKRSLLPVACTVADLLNFNTELVTHHANRIKNVDAFKINQGKMIANSFDLEDIYSRESHKSPYFVNHLRFKD